MVGTGMFAEIKKRKQMDNKKQQAARELELDKKTVRKYWDMDVVLYLSSCRKAEREVTA